MKMTILVFHLALAAVLMSAGAAAAVVVDGVESGTEAVLVRPARVPVALSRSFDHLIDFDNADQPCVFIMTVALTDEYEAEGVVFSGPAPGDGGAVLHECGNFHVYGQSSPNFLAFNLMSGLSDGSQPYGPERLDFATPVTRVSALVGAGTYAGTELDMCAYDAADNLVDRSTVTLQNVLDEISVSGRGITHVVIGQVAPPVWVLDDLGFDTGDPVIEVALDVMPGSLENPVNCRSGSGAIPVAVLTTETFDALSIDHTTVRFGPGEASEFHVAKGPVPHGGDDAAAGPVSGAARRHEEDVDGDGDLDLLFHFARDDAAIRCGDVEAVLTGQTYDGQAIRGSDVIRTVPGRETEPEPDGAFRISPNPFNPSTTIAFETDALQRVRIGVYDLRGRLVTELANAFYPAGAHAVEWTGRDAGSRAVPSGTYFFRIEVGGRVEIHKATLMK